MPFEGAAVQDFGKDLQVVRSEEVEHGTVAAANADLGPLLLALVEVLNAVEVAGAGRVAVEDSSVRQHALASSRRRVGIRVRVRRRLVSSAARVQVPNGGAIVAVQPGAAGVACRRGRVHQSAAVRVGIVAIRLVDFTGMADADGMAEFVRDDPVEVDRGACRRPNGVDKSVLRHDGCFEQGDSLLCAAGTLGRCEAIVTVGAPSSGCRRDASRTNSER